MNFLDDRKLALRLKEGVVSSKEKFLYFMMLNVWTYISMSSFYIDWMYEPATRITHITDAILLIVNIVGLNLCYDINAEGDDRDFIERITCLSFPAFVRATFLGIILIVPAVGLIKYLNLGIDDSFVFFFGNLIVFPYMYYRLATSIKGVAHPAKPSVDQMPKF